MTISLELPDTIARQLRLDGPQASRRALEELAVEGYRRGDISRGQISELLSLSLWETEAFLKEHHCGLGMTPTEFDTDSRRLREFLAR